MEDVFRSMLITSGQAALVAVLVLIAQWVFRNRLSKAWRHSLWFLVVLRLVAPVLPESPTSMFHLTQVEAVAPVDRIDPSDPTDPAIEFALGPVTEGLPFEVDTITVQPIEDQSAGFAPAEPVVVPDRTPINYWAMAMWTWIVITSLLVVRVLIGHLLFCRRMRSNRVLDDDRFERLFADCRERSGCRMKVRPEETDAIESPALYGLFSPRLLLPTGLLERFSDEELRYILLHELAHVRRGDVIVNWLATALSLLHWFNPALLFAFHRMRADRELACDELALSWTQKGDKEAYGQTVIKLLEQFVAPKAAPGVIGILENKSRMKQRLRMIAGFTHRRRWTIGATVVLGLLSAVSLTEVVSKDDRDTDVVATDKDDRETDWTQDEKKIRHVYDAIQRYRADHGNQWPPYLSSLIPKYLSRADIEHQGEDRPPRLSAPDPKLDAVYEYYFSEMPLADGWAKQLTDHPQPVTMRAYHTVMVERFGNRSAVLHRELSDRTLNISLSGEIYETKERAWFADFPEDNDQKPKSWTEVRVVDEINEIPVAGARVTYFHGDRLAFFPRRTVVSNDDGIARIGLLTDEIVGGIYLAAEAKGYFAAEDDFDVEDLSEAPSFKLYPTARVGGRVVDENSQPIVGARLTARRGTNPNWSRPEILGYDSVQFRATTDANGEWSFESLSYGHSSLNLLLEHERVGELSVYVVDKLKEDHRSRPMNLLFDDVKQGRGIIRLTEGFGYAGRVTGPGESDQPVANAELVVAGPAMQTIKTRTDAQGKFAINGIQFAPGETNRSDESNMFTRTTFTINAPGFSTYQDEVHGTYSRSNLVIQMSTAKSVRPLVLDARTKQPIEGVKVSYYGKSKSKDTPAWSGVTDKDGRVGFDEASTGKNYYSFRRRGYYPKTGSYSGDPVIHLNPHPRFSGTVADAKSGKPLPLFSIKVVGWDGEGPYKNIVRERLFNATDGRFELSGGSVSLSHRAFKRYKLIVSAKGYAPYSTEVLPSKNGDQKFEIPLAPGNHLSGQVFAPNGKRVANAHVVVAKDDETTALQKGKFWLEDYHASTRTAVSGHFSLNGAITNRLLQIAHPDYGFATVQVGTLETNSVVRLQPWARLRATVKADGKPLARQYLGLDDAGQRGFLLQSGNDRVDEDGNLIVTHVPPGSYFTETLGYGVVRKLDKLTKFEAGKETVLNIDFDLRRVRAQVHVEGLNVKWGKSIHHLAFKPLNSEVAKMKFRIHGVTPPYPGWIGAFPWDSMRRYRFGARKGFNVSKIDAGWYELLIALRKGDATSSNLMEQQFYHHRRIVHVQNDDGSETVTLPPVHINEDNVILVGAEQVKREQLRHTYRGQVTSAAGQPVANAQVMHIKGASKRNLGGGEFKLLSSDFKIRTDKDGRFLYSGHESQDWLCVADKQHGFAAHRFADLGDNPEINLKPWGQLRLSVKINGKRLPGNPRVNLWSLNPPCFFTDHFHTQDVKEFNHLPPGTYHVSVTSDDGQQTWHLDHSDRVVINSGKTTAKNLDLQLKNVTFNVDAVGLPVDSNWRNNRIYLRKSADDYPGGVRPPVDPVQMEYPSGVVHHYHEKVVHASDIKPAVSFTALPGRYDLLLAIRKTGGESDSLEFFHHVRRLEIGRDGESRLLPDTKHEKSLDLSNSEARIRVTADNTHVVRVAN